MGCWNIKALKDHSIALNGEDKSTIERINSTSRAIDIFCYHLEQAKTQNDLTIGSTPREQMELVMPPEEKMLEVWKRKLAIQANTQACIHTARSIHDLFAQLVNGLLFQNPIAVHDCDVYKVTQKLEDGELKTALSNLLGSFEFKYVNAFVNTIKHRNLVDFGALVSFEENRSGVQFNGFKFKGEPYDKLWAEDVLKLTLTVKNTVITAGCLLNQEFGVIDE
ncbi:hypothetical protein [Thaumasiovibrio sp. DFM-14]|uniref:hypothetical protein n=1 Tax=Thaumasiovibrio sp. DFM-14 TaxID=3384792 RepID=UPI00399F746D